MTRGTSVTGKTNQRPQGESRQDPVWRVGERSRPSGALTSGNSVETVSAPRRVPTSSPETSFRRTPTQGGDYESSSRRNPFREVDRHGVNGIDILPQLFTQNNRIDRKFVSDHASFTSHLQSVPITGKTGRTTDERGTIRLRGVPGRREVLEETRETGVRSQEWSGTGRRCLGYGVRGRGPEGVVGGERDGGRGRDRKDPSVLVSTLGKKTVCVPWVSYGMRQVFLGVRW